jgi:hypothetical protein
LVRRGLAASLSQSAAGSRPQQNAARNKGAIRIPASR